MRIHGFAGGGEQSSRGGEFYVHISGVISVFDFNRSDPAGITTDLSREGGKDRLAMQHRGSTIPSIRKRDDL